MTRSGQGLAAHSGSGQGMEEGFLAVVVASVEAGPLVLGSCS